MHRVLTVITLVFVSLVATGCNRNRQYQWQVSESSEGRFRLQFPAAVVSSQDERTDIDGTRFAAHKLSALPRKEVVYALDWWDGRNQKSNATEALFAHFRECDVLAAGGGRVQEKRLLVGGFPATEIEVISDHGPVMVNRVIRVGDRFYSMFVIDTSGYMDRKNVSRFFDSWSLI